MNLPEDFILRTKAMLGEEWTAFQSALQEPVPVSIRINPDKMSEEELFVLFPEATPIPWTSYGYYLPERPLFTLDPYFHAGCYYVQEASSMYLEQIIRKHIAAPVKALDLCAAPGGKSTHLLSVLPSTSLLVANEVIHSRAHILAENIIKWGNPYVVVTTNDPKEHGRLTHYYDLIVADVPCSGEGMFRKDPASMQEWSLANVRLCAERQRRIIGDVWQALAPGGLLVYSTCTYNKEENEDNIVWIGSELGATLVEEPKRFLPHQTKGEGFFIAILRKDGDIDDRSQEPKRTKKQKGNGKQPDVPSSVKTWITGEVDEFSFTEEDGICKAFPSRYAGDYRSLKEQLRVLFSGVYLGEAKGKDMIPQQALAMSAMLREESFPVWEVDKETALRYLRKEAFSQVPASLPKAYILLIYKGKPLGFIKNIGNRANNLYPQEWRIRMNIK